MRGEQAPLGAPARGPKKPSQTGTGLVSSTHPEQANGKHPSCTGPCRGFGRSNVKRHYAHKTKTMNDTTPQPPTPDPLKGSDAERTKQVTVAGWTAGVSAVVAMMTVTHSTSWPEAFAIGAVAAMVTAACYFILRREK